MSPVSAEPEPLEAFARSLLADAGLLESLGQDHLRDVVEHGLGSSTIAAIRRQGEAARRLGNLAADTATAFRAADGLPFGECGLVLPSDPTLRAQLEAFASELTLIDDLHTHFHTLDTAARPGSDADGLISIDDLRVAASRDDAAGSVARALLAHSGLIGHLDTAHANTDFLRDLERGEFFSEGGDGRISRADLDAYLSKRSTLAVLTPIATTLDTARQGDPAAADGVFSKNDMQAYLESGSATEQERAALQYALQTGAFDETGGFAAGLADLAAGLGPYSLAVTTAGVILLVTVPPAGATVLAVGTGASLTIGGTEMIAGAVADEPEHVVNGGLTVAAGTFAWMGGTVVTNSVLSDPTLRRQLAGVGVGVVIDQSTDRSTRELRQRRRVREINAAAPGLLCP